MKFSVAVAEFFCKLIMSLFTTYFLYSCVVGSISLGGSNELYLIPANTPQLVSQKLYLIPANTPQLVSQKLYLIPANTPQLVSQKLWYVLICLWDGAYKISLAANQEGSL